MLRSASKIIFIAFILSITGISYAESGADPCQKGVSGLKMFGSCVLGAVVGTFVFPGIGTAAGCVGVSGASFAVDKVTSNNCVDGSKEDKVE